MPRKKQPVWQILPSVAVVLLALPILLPFGLLIPLAALALRFLNKAVVYILIWVRSLRKGNYVLVVYSESTTCNEYMSTEVLPLLQQNAVILDWSERKQWPRWSLAPHVFRTFGGRREFNLIVVVFRPLHRAQVFRFWQGFENWEHGRTEPVEFLRQRLLAAL